MAAAAPRRIEIVPWGFWKSTSNTPTRQQSSAALGGGCILTGTVLNHEMTWDVFLDSGTWALDVIYRTGSFSGISTLYLDSTSLGTVDFYAVGSPYNVVSTLTGITVATAGNYTLKSKMASKNASSSGYYSEIQLFVLRRTGA